MGKDYKDRGSLHTRMRRRGANPRPIWLNSFAPAFIIPFEFFIVTILLQLFLAVIHVFLNSILILIILYVALPYLLLNHLIRLRSVMTSW